MDSARAKSEALDNFDSLLKQNIKSYNVKRRRWAPGEIKAKNMARTVRRQLEG